MPNQDPLQLTRENAFPSLARKKRNFCSARLAVPGNLSCTHLGLLTSALEEETRGRVLVKSIQVLVALTHPPVCAEHI